MNSPNARNDAELAQRPRDGVTSLGNVGIDPRGQYKSIMTPGWPWSYGSSYDDDDDDDDGDDPTVHDKSASGVVRRSDSRTPFAELMALRPVRDGGDDFRSLTAPYAPGLATYGGHVLAQAAWAASQTVRAGFVVHNVQCLFTLPGDAERAFVYAVQRVRDGGSYCTRAVTVRQPDGDGSADGDGVCFTCICSFKRDEESSFAHQHEARLEARYGEVLRGKRPEDHGLAPAIDTPWYRKLALDESIVEQFPGLDMRKVDMSAYNAGRPPSEARQLQYYTCTGALPRGDANLAACAHLYASDRNSLFLISSAHGVGDSFTGMGSVSHSVVFHGPSQDLLFADGGRERAWFCQEAWTSRSAAGRALHESKIWDGRGRHVASTWQDGLIRVRRGAWTNAALSNKPAKL
ncbi:MAG: hypothetical protein M1832_004230 [Thelocarpon impressellum]|nr:MAG: hypothetical protein M1832_004230 [Thelocarpon impressellum]